MFIREHGIFISIAHINDNHNNNNNTDVAAYTMHVNLFSARSVELFMYAPSIDTALYSSATTSILR